MSKCQGSCSRFFVLLVWYLPLSSIETETVRVWSLMPCDVVQNSVSIMA